MRHKPVLVGMNNPINGSPGFELYPHPPGCTGHRLWEMLRERTGARRGQYLATFERRNLVTGNRGWDSNVAEQTASDICREFFGTGRVIVLLGEDVRRSFRLKKNLIHPLEWGGCTWRQIPHPSGRNLWYNHVENRNLVANLLEELYDDYHGTKREHPVSGRSETSQIVGS